MVRLANAEKTSYQDNLASLPISPQPQIGNLLIRFNLNRGLTVALREIRLQSGKSLFNHVVLAAPDIDADIFKHRIAPNITTTAKRVTLYASQLDLALIASRYFNNGARIGDSGRGIAPIPGIDTIDASAVDTSLLGHSYYGSNIPVCSQSSSLLVAASL